MDNRRAHPRIRVDDTARIALDEHRSLPCVLFDRSLTGVRVALPEVDQVPDRFVLTLENSGEVLVCQVMWRKSEEFGARTSAPGEAESRAPASGANWRRPDQPGSRHAHAASSRIGWIRSALPSKPMPGDSGPTTGPSSTRIPSRKPS